MPYMLLIIEPTGQRKSRPEAEGRALYERMVRFGDDLRERGLLSASESLHSEEAAARVRVRGGRRSVVDGPFSESKEMIGGFFILQCDSREEAIAIAGECPAAEWATVEVREFRPCYESGG